MKSEDALRMIERLTYKPGWTFAASLYNQDILHVECRMPDVPCTKERGKTYTLQFTKDLNLASLTDAGLLVMIYEMLDWAERHECKEWFKLDGVRVVDPHNMR